MNIAIIPARGGSKRIHKKNIKLFHWQPIISYSIETAIKSNIFDKVIVSTDDVEIANISNKYGAITPFLRPTEISDDKSELLPVIKHSIEWLVANNQTPSNICCILATAPFLSSEDLKKGFNLLEGSDNQFVLSVTRFNYPIQRALELNSDGMIDMLNPEFYSTRSQDLNEYWHDAGQFYFGSLSTWMKQRCIFSKSIPLQIENHRVVDIDTDEDWLRAELMYKAYKS